MIIYKATNKVNGKIYIGQTVRPLDERIGEHKRHCNTVLGKAIAKYGIDNIYFETIDHAESIEELNEKERYWIKFYDCLEPKGYNLCYGGDNTLGYHHRESAKRKMSVSKKKLYVGEGNPFYGKKHSAEARAKMSAARKGRPLTEDWKAKVAAKVKRAKVKNLDTGEVFTSIQEAADKYGITATHISRVCRGKRKSCGGYRWEYYQDT